MKNLFKFFPNMAFFILLIGLILINFNCSERNQVLAGKWQGELILDDVDLTIIMNIEKVNHKHVSIKIDIPQQEIYDIDTKSVIINDSIKMEIPVLNSTFKGKITDRTFSLNGYWKSSCCPWGSIELTKVK